MKHVALGLLCLDGEELDTQRILEWSLTIPRIYVIDARTPGESFSTLPDPCLHYAPFRQKASLGTALNRALALAFEENMAWLWLCTSATDIPSDLLLSWSQKVSATVGLYQADPGTSNINLWRRPSAGHLVSVTAARSLGGWNTKLPPQLVFWDFHDRLKAAGWLIAQGPNTRQIQSPPPIDVYGGLCSLLVLMQRRLSRKT